LVWWLFDPAPFLVIRASVNVVSTILFALLQNWLFASWFAFVTAATFVSAAKAEMIKRKVPK
jgi:hypothetical protein